MPTYEIKISPAMLALAIAKTPSLAELGVHNAPTYSGGIITSNSKKLIASLQSVIDDHSENEATAWLDEEKKKSPVHRPEPLPQGKAEQSAKRKPEKRDKG